MQNIIDITVSNHKQQIRLNNDDNRILELDLADPSILARLNTGMDEIEQLLNHRDKLEADISTIDTDTAEGEKVFLQTVNAFANLESQMREILNRIFDGDVCTPYMQATSAFSVKDGVFLFEEMFSTLLNLYETSIQTETKNIKARLNKHTKKYLK